MAVSKNFLGHFKNTERQMLMDSSCIFVIFRLNLGRNYSINSGFLPVAQLNNIIVVFPLTTAIESNMNGCWDFFSYTGKNFGNC